MTRRALLALFAALYVVAIAAGLFTASTARADVGLVDACVDEAVEGGTTGECANASRAWVRPLSDTLVLGCPASTSLEQCTWNSATVQYRRFTEWAADAWIWTCALDIEAGVWPTTTADPCGSNSADKPRIPKADVILASTGPIIDGQGTVTLSWSAPTQYEDGSALSAADLEGYTLFWGEASRAGRGCAPPMSSTDSTCYPNRLQIDQGATESTEFSLELDGPVTLYFAMIARVVDGRLSDYSNEAARTFTLDVEEPEPEPEPNPNAPTDITLDIEVECTASDGFTCRFTVQ